MIIDKLNALIERKEDYGECEGEALVDLFHYIFHPYENIDISVIVSSLDVNKLEKFITSLIKTSPNFKNTEIIIKIDSLLDAYPYEEMLKSTNFQYKILTYPCFNKRRSCQHFFNDMAAIASGKLIWLSPEDGEVAYGDWYSLFMGTRDSFADNIYYVHTLAEGGTPRSCPGAPAVSKEWLDALGGIFSAMPNNDRWILYVGNEIDRKVVILKEKMLMQFPPGSRIMGSVGKRYIFQPSVYKAAKILKHAISERIND